MAKTIKIPEGYDPLEIMVNNRLYVYKPGETVTVPDDVASAIQSMIDLNPKEAPEVKLETISYDPVKDAGKLLSIKKDLGAQKGYPLWSKDIPDRVNALENSQYTTMDIQDIAAGVVEEKVPDAPESDGTYILTCTVNGSGTGVEWAQAQGGSGVFWITATEEDIEDTGDGTHLITLDKTFLEIYTAMRNRSLCIIKHEISGAPNYEEFHELIYSVGLDSAPYSTNNYIVYVTEFAYAAATINDYPTATY